MIAVETFKMVLHTVDSKRGLPIEIDSTFCCVTVFYFCVSDVCLHYHFVLCCTVQDVGHILPCGRGLCDETDRHVLLLHYLFKDTVLIILNVSFVI